jgi:hypothetical protein
MLLGLGIVCLTVDFIIGFVLCGLGVGAVDWLLWGTPEVQATSRRFGSAAVAAAFGREPVESYVRALGAPRAVAWARYLFVLVPFLLWTLSLM